jgi:GGDEF domain-containing protein
VSDDFPDPRLAERLMRAGRAAQTLSETLWEALQEELTDPRPERVAELSEQLGEVAAAVASLARVDVRAREEPAEPANARPVEQELRFARATTYGEPISEEPAPPGEPAEAPVSPSPAVLIDELATTVAAGGPQAQARPQIEIRDERSAEGPAAWIDSIGRRLERHEQDRSPFAVLLVELVDLDRLRHTESAEELSRLMSFLEDALARELRPDDSLTRERPGRYWLLVPQTDGPGAQALIERIARAVRSSVSHRGTPLEVAVGVAVCPEDGRRASELAAHADVGLYAARAAGRSSIR